MYYELNVAEFQKEDYEKLINLLREEGVEAKVNVQQGKNMFDAQVIGAVLDFSTNVAANVLAGIIVAGLGKGLKIVINGIKVKVNSAKEMEQVIQDINDEL